MGLLERNINNIGDKATQPWPSDSSKETCGGASLQPRVDSLTSYFSLSPGLTARGIWLTSEVLFGTRSSLQVPDMLCQRLFGFGETSKRLRDRMSFWSFSHEMTVVQFGMKTVFNLVFSLVQTHGTQTSSLEYMCQYLCVKSKLVLWQPIWGFKRTI